MKNKIAELQVSYKPKKLGNEVKICHSEKAYEVILENWNRNTIELYEEFKVLLLLNNSNEVLGIYTLSKGGMNFTTVDLRIMFGVILKSAAIGFIAVHCHPSGKLKPSIPDRDIHKKIKQIAKFHNLNYLDNLIITPASYYSFQDEGDF